MFCNVQELMTKKPLTLAPTDDVAMARALMQHGGIRHVPVVDGGRLVGLITRQSLIRAETQHGPASAALPVSDYMTSQVQTARVGMPVRKAARLMLQHKLGCLPVLDDTGALVGILTESDLVRLAADLAEDLDRAELAITRGLGHE
jgi:CBS domain-containing protein